MHELGIAQSVLSAVETEMTRYAPKRPVKVGLRIGPLAGIDRCSLEFCFEVAVKDTAFEGLALDIQTGAADELEFAYLELEEDVE
jgi:hydrogenase nickel incorporation protein HypA/HybF